MNIFSNAFLSLIFILCPLFIYIVLISSNNRITSNNKDIIFDATLLSIIYIVISFNSNNYPIINFLLLNSVILIAYLRDRLLIGNIIVILLLLIYYDSFNFITFMIVPYFILYLINILRKKINITDFLFIDLFLLVDYTLLILWILNSNYQFYIKLGFINMILLIVFNYALIHVIYLPGI